MRESIKTPENREPFVDKDVLAKVVEEMLAKRDKKEVLTEGFPRRAFFLYNLQMGFRFGKFQDEEAEEFYKKIEPEIALILKDKGRQCENINIKKADTAQEAGGAKPQDWYSKWDDENYRRNQLRPWL